MEKKRGVPENLLEENVWKAVSKCCPKDIKSCHRLKRSGRYIFKIKYCKLFLNYWTNTAL